MGSSRVLHLMNPLRHDFVANCLADAPPEREHERGLKYLDVGCGGGIFAESIARTIPTDQALNTKSSIATAASVTAIDPSPTLIQIAHSHARTDPKIDAHLRSGRFQYQNRTLEDLVDAQAGDSASKPESSESTSTSTSTSSGYDVVTLFEVLEHVDPDPGHNAPQNFLTNCLRLVRPGGWLVGSTIARTFPSWIVNQVIAEAPWPVGVVPKGTHEWAKFVNPGEVRGWLEEGLMRGKDGGARRAGAEALSGMRWVCEGVVYFPGVGWKMVKGSEDWGNYFWAVRKRERERLFIILYYYSIIFYYFPLYFILFYFILPILLFLTTVIMDYSIIHPILSHSIISLMSATHYGVPLWH